MPKLITRKKKVYAKKRVKFSAPHSPFQKLVDKARLAKKLSIAALAASLKPKVNRGSMWIWLHNENGYPSKNSATPARLESLSKVLGIPLPQLQEALDASRLLYGTEIPVPPTQDALGDLIEILEQDRRVTIRKDWVLNLAKRLHQGTAVEIAASKPASGG